MKNSSLIFLTLFAVIILAGCSSSPRFTTDNEKTYDEERINRTKPAEVIKPPIELENVRVLESSNAIASYYADKFHGRTTANGETYDMYAMTAAHINYPFNTEVRVTNLLNNKFVVLRINDRKPDTNGRAIDLSYRAAELLDMVTSGIAKVNIEVLKWGEE